MSEVAAYTPSVPRALQLSSGFFLLNPDGDLQATQNTFEDWLQQQLCLQVRSSVKCLIGMLGATAG